MPGDMFTCDDPLRFVGFLPLHDEGRGSERQIVEEEEVNKLCLRPGCFFFFDGMFGSQAHQCFVHSIRLFRNHSGGQVLSI